jgi:hypothetical protein
LFSGNAEHLFYLHEGVAEVDIAFIFLEFSVLDLEYVEHVVHQI